MLQYLLANGLLRFRIPILFAISGYLFAWRDDGTAPYGARLVRRVRTLAGLSPFQPQANFVSQYTGNQLLLRWLVIPAAFQLWFLRTLIVLMALYPLLRTVSTRWPRVFFTAAVILWIPGGDVFFVESEGLLFYTLGVWLASRNVDVIAKPAWLRRQILLPMWLLLCGAKTWMAFAIEQGTPAVAITMLLMHRAGEIVGLLTAWYGMDGIVNWAMAREWFRWLTGFSFMIYALHVPAVNYATEAALSFGAKVPHINFLTYVFVPLFIIAAAVLIAATLRRGARPVYALLTGGRGL